MWRFPLAPLALLVAWVLVPPVVLVSSGCTVEIDLPDDALPGEDVAQPLDVPASPADGADDARPADATPILDVPAPIRDVVPPRDVPPPADVPPTDAVVFDAGPRPDLPTLRYCPWNLDELPLLTRSRTLRGEDYASATNDPTPADRACDTGLFPDRTHPERVYAIVPDSPATLSLRARCDGWDCDALLLDGDCITSNVAACVTQDGDVRLDRSVDARLWLLQMEARFGTTEGPFDLHVALNYGAGRDPCPIAGEVRLSELATLGECAIDDDGDAVRTVIFEADTATGDARDDVFVDCRAAGIDPDSVGGAPDRIWAVVHDAPDGAARRLAVTATAVDEAWEPVIAVTSAPCGAKDGVIDCDRGAARPAAVAGITVFDGETLYVVVDGVGELAFEERMAGPVTVAITVSDPTCPAR